MADKAKRKGNKPWKGVYGQDRKYTARVDRMNERLTLGTDSAAPFCPTCRIWHIPGAGPCTATYSAS